MKNQMKWLLLMAGLLLSVWVGMAQDDVDFPIIDDAFNVLTELNTVAYYSPTSLSDVVTFYKTEMELEGWMLITELEGRGRTGTILVFVNSAGDEVTIVVGEGPARDGQVRDVSSIVIDHPYGEIFIDISTEGESQPVETIETTETTETSETPAEPQPLTQTLNLQLIFDASGSMAEVINGQQKIIAARQAIDALVRSLPTDDVNLNVGFRVFGHEGDNSQAGRPISCASTELIVPMANVDSEALLESANAYSPNGWTPITLALTDALQDFSIEEDGRNAIILVSDGAETCDGDPVSTAEMLANSGADITIHVIGLGVDEAIANQLTSIATTGGGSYLNAVDERSLTTAIFGLVGEEFQLSGGRLALPDRVIEYFSAGSAEFSGVTITNGVIQIESFSAGNADLSGVAIDLNTGEITIEGGEAGNVTIEDLGIDISDFTTNDD